MAGMEAEEATLRASDGLAPARCGGLRMSLFAPCLAARGAGSRTNTTAAAEQMSAAAGEALHVVQSRMGACGGRQVPITRSSPSAGGAAPGTLVPGGVAARRSPRHTRRGGCEVACSAARAALQEVEAVVRRMEVQYEVGYDLIYITTRLAPSFGRTRGQLRGQRATCLSGRRAGRGLLWWRLKRRRRRRSSLGGRASTR